MERHKTIHFHTEVARKLSEVLLGNYHFLEFLQDLGGVFGQRVDVLELCEGHLLAGGAHLVHCGVEVSVGGAKTNYEQFCVLVAKHLNVGNGDFGDFLGAFAAHKVVVFGVGGDCAGLVVLFEAAKDVRESLPARYCPIAYHFLVPHIRCPLAEKVFRHVGRIDGGIVGEVGEFECCRTVAEECVREKNHGGHVFEGNLASVVSRVETVGGAEGCDNGHWRFAVATVESLQEVCLFRFGGQTRCRAAALYVENHQRKFEDDSQVHRFGFEADAGARS